MNSTAKIHLNICLWILSIYNIADSMYSEHDIIDNECICETIKHHQNNNNLNMWMDINSIKQCYKQHIIPFQILLKNLHPKCKHVIHKVII